MKGNTVKHFLLSTPEAPTCEGRRGFLRNSINLALVGIVSSAIPCMTLANMVATNSSLIRRNSLRFKGYMYESTLNAYRLGPRHYSPFLRSFLTPDPYSPYGVAGENRYQYCEGDPINKLDPSGYLSNRSIWVIVLSAISIVTSIVTLGAGVAALSAGGGSIAGIALVVSGVTGIVSGSLNIAAASTENNPGLSKNLSNAALGFGIVSIITGIIGFAGILNSTAQSSTTVGKIFSSGVSNSTRTSSTVVNTFANSAATTKMAGGLGDGVAAASQAAIATMAENTSTAGKAVAAIIFAESLPLGVQNIRGPERTPNQKANTLHDSKASSVSPP